jgi:hypothetical protein
MSITPSDLAPIGVLLLHRDFVIPMLSLGTCKKERRSFQIQCNALGKISKPRKEKYLTSFLVFPILEAYFSGGAGCIPCLLTL